jgi:ankyrin repeat protein
MVNTQEQLNNKLLNAVVNGDLINIKVLIEQGADIHAWNDHFLSVSVQSGNLEVVKLLVENGVSIYSNDAIALRLSAANDYLDIVKYLIFDCHMFIAEKRMNHLQEDGCLEVVNIIKCREFNKELNKNKTII